MSKTSIEVVSVLSTMVSAVEELHVLRDENEAYKARIAELERKLASASHENLQEKKSKILREDLRKLNPLLTHLKLVTNAYNFFLQIHGSIFAWLLSSKQVGIPDWDIAVFCNKDEIEKISQLMRHIVFQYYPADVLVDEISNPTAKYPGSCLRVSAKNMPSLDFVFQHYSLKECDSSRGCTFISDKTIDIQKGISNHESANHDKYINIPGAFHSVSMLLDMVDNQFEFYYDDIILDFNASRRPIRIPKLITAFNRYLKLRTKGYITNFELDIGDDDSIGLKCGHYLTKEHQTFLVEKHKEDVLCEYYFCPECNKRLNVSILRYQKKGKIPSFWNGFEENDEFDLLL